MEKLDKADRKKNKDNDNKTSSQDDQNVTAKALKVKVGDDTSLVSAVMSNTPFELAENYTTIITPQSHHVPIAPIMQALHNNTTVKNLIINQRIWDHFELREFVRCLASVNQGIDRIVLQAHNFEPNFVEALTKILKSNKRIKIVEISMGSTTQLHEQGVLRLCDSMEYYHFEELVITWVALSIELYNTLFESLRYNQSIRSIRILGDMISHTLPSLCDTLICNPTITQLHIEHCQLTEASCLSLNQVLKLNNVKALMFKGTKFTDTLKLIAKELQENTSVQDLTLQSCQMDWKLFGEVLIFNKTIKRLDISYNDIKDRQIQYLNLGWNTSLTELNLITNHFRDITPLLLQLMENKTLKKLAVGPTTREIDPKIFEKFISSNNSLTHLKIDSEYNPHKKEAFEAIADGLEVNRTLRAFDIRMERIDYNTFIYFIDALKRNNTLLELSITQLSRINLDRRPSNGSDIDDIVMDLLNTNKTLRHITGADAYPHLAERLKSNRDTQDKIISDTCSLIKMIVMKPDAFILPIELWLNVIKYVSYDCTPFNFEQFFRKFIT